MGTAGQSLGDFRRRLGGRRAFVVLRIGKSHADMAYSNSVCLWCQTVVVYR